MKCVYVRPASQNVVDWLNDHKVSYSIYREDDVIFANLDDYEGLADIATVTDPVVCVDGEWFFIGDDKNLTDLIGPVKTEHEARVGFVHFISWVGEFVNNG